MHSSHKTSNMTSSVTSSTESLPRYECSRLDLTLAPEQFSIMCRQEVLPAYCTSDYLAVAKSLDSAGDLHLASPPVVESIDLECRERMVEWSFQVADFAKLRRETVGSAIALLDRFLSTDCPESRKIMRSRKLFQLASMSTLFLAIKMNEKAIITADVFAELSRGNYSASDIHRTEEEVLEALEWRVNGPTVHEFLRQIMMLCPAISQNLTAANSDFVDICNYQLDLSIGDYFFVLKKPSVIAFAAILNAADNFFADPPRHNTNLSDFVRELSVATDIDPSSADVLDSMARLRMLLKNNGHMIRGDRHRQSNPRTSTKERDSSPSCVARFAQAQSPKDMCEDDNLSEYSDESAMELDAFEESFSDC